MPRRTEVYKPDPEEILELRSLFLALKTPQDLAAMLGIPYGRLVYHLYKVPPAAKYETFEIPKKSGGVRLITAPISALKLIQRTLNTYLNCVYSTQVLRDGSLEIGPKPSVHGFVWDRSIKTNAEQHARKRLLLNIDLKDFFPSVNFGRVRGLFMEIPYNLPPPVATVLAQICSYKDGGRDELPQGAPTSPAITNMICARMDSQLQRLAREYNLTYTRYADDITFSTTRKTFPQEIITAVQTNGKEVPVIGEQLKQIIENNGFSVNDRKVRLQDRRYRQEVTGLTVNEFPNITRPYVSRTRAMLHAWKKFGLEAAEQEFRENHGGGEIKEGELRPSFINALRGRIEFIGMVRGKEDKLYVRLLKEHKRLVNPESAGEPLSPEDQLKRDIVAQLYRFVRKTLKDKSEQTEPLELIQGLHSRLKETRISVSLLYRKLRELRQDGYPVRHESPSDEPLVVVPGAEGVQALEERLDLTGQKLSAMVRQLEADLLRSLEGVRENVGEIREFLGLDGMNLSEYEFLSDPDLKRQVKERAREMLQAERMDRPAAFCFSAFLQIENVVKYKLRQPPADDNLKYVNKIGEDTIRPKDGSPFKEIKEVKDIPNILSLKIGFIIAHGKDYEADKTAMKVYWLFDNVRKLRNPGAHEAGGVELKRVVQADKQLNPTKKAILLKFIDERDNSYRQVKRELQPLLKKIFEFSGNLE